MGRWLEISCFLLFLFYFSSQDSVYGNKIDMTGIQNAKNSRKLDLVFLIHTSNQITDRSFELVKTFLKNLLRDSDIDSGDLRVGIAFYGRNPNILFNLPQYNTKADLIGAIDAIPSSYRSDEANLARGLKVAKQIMLSSSNDQRPDVPNAVVVITDGTSTVDTNEIHSAAVDLKSIAYIFGVAIGIGTFGEMARIVTEPANVNYFGIVAIERLHEVEPQLTEQIMALQGDAAPLDVPTDAKADIVFLVHMSKKSTKADQNLLKMFMKKLLSSADIDSGAVRVAIVTYNVNSKVVSNFDTYTSKTDVFNAIDNMNRFKGPKANAAAGLKMVLNKISINKSGDRSNVKNTLIIVTDQQSVKVQNSKKNADKLRGKDTEIFTVGVGFDSSAELNEVANHPAGVHAQFVEDYSKINEANDLLLQSIPSLMKKTVSRSTNRPAPVDNTIYQTSDELDLVFAIHISENVNDVEMRELMNFLINMFGRANIAAGKVRVGVITYGETESVIFDLNEYNDATAMGQAISSTLTGSKSNKVNVANLLESVRTKMFQDAKGDRKGVPDALIILTDKISNMEVGEIQFQAAETQKKGIRVFTVGINLSDKAELETVASRPTDQNVFTVTSYSELPRTEQEIVNQLNVFQPVATVTVTNRATTPSVVTRPTGRPIPTAPPSIPPTVTIPPTRKPTTPAPPTTPPKVISTGPPAPRVEVSTAAPAPDKLAELTTAAPPPVIPVEKTTAPPAPVKPVELETAAPSPVIPVEIKTAPPVIPVEIATVALPIEPVEILSVRTPPGPDTDGGRTTAVMPTPKPPTSETGQDIVLMLDSSVTDEKFFLMLIFARAFVGMADFDTGKVRIGLMLFNSEAKIEAHLNTFHRKADLLQVIDMLPQSSGKSNKAKAFNEVRKNMFVTENGDRPKAENKVILITGSKTGDIAKAKKRAEELEKEAKAEVFVLGLGDVDPNELYSFASAPENEHVYQVNSAETVMNIMDPLLNKVKQVYVPPPTTPAPTTRRTPRTTLSTRRRVPVTIPPRPETTQRITTRRTTTRRTTPRRTTPRRTTPRRTTPRRTTPRRPVVTTPKRIYRPSDCTSKADILFVVDSSGSVGEENFAKVIDFVYSTIESLDIESGLYNVALITFSDEARTEFYLNSFTRKEDIENATAAVKYVYGSTHTAIALRMARRMIFTEVNGDRPDAPNIVVIITDGQSNINQRETLPQARLLKQSGVSVITVAVGFATQTEELIGMTSPPVAENLFSVDDFSELENLHARIVEPICKGQHLCANNPCKNGGECYDTLKHYICICAKGFYGTECDKVCPQPADVAFILDSSTSVGWRTFQRMKRFAEGMVRDLAIGYCGHRIALVKYSSRPLIEFHLDRFNRQESVIRSIDDTSYTRGHADMANAIKFVSQEIFSPRHGDRDGVKNIAYLLTHGQIDMSREDTLRQAELAISSGIHIIPVAFNVRRSYELDTIAAAQGIKTTEIFGADVDGMTDTLLHPIFETQSHCEPNPCLNGGKCVNYPFTYKCECKRGFTGENCEKQCNSRADMILVIDTSRYVTRPALRRVKRMLRKTIKRLSFSHQNIRVAVITYDAEPRLRLTLDKGRHKQDVMAVLSMLRPGRTDPNPGAALRMANQDVLRQKLGDRLHVPNYLVLVTKSVRDLDEMLLQSRNLKMKGTRIMALGLVSSTSFVASSLNDVVSLPLDKNKFVITNSTKEEHVADVIQKLAAAVCYEEICSENPCLNGGTCQIDKGSAVCDCPRGFAGRWCQSTCAQNVDIVFVLDTSGNISPGEFRLMKEFAIEIAEKLSIGTHKSRVAAVTYSSRAHLGFTLDMFSSARDVRNALSSLLYEYGNSNAVAALELVRSKIFNYKTGDRPDVKNFVIFLSNTESKIHPEHTVASARALRNIAHIYAIGIANYDIKELYDIASLPYLLNVFTAENYEGLFNYTNGLTQSFCKASTFCDSNPCQNGGVCEPASATFRCKCADGYAGRFCERRCEIVKDIAFVLDSSSSVGEINFERMLDFTSKLVDDLADRNMRYALITYSNVATLVFTFSRYKDAETVASIIKRTAYKPGSTNTASALANAADIFSIDYGSRPSAEKVVILITDGLSNVDYHLTIPNAERLKARVNKVMAIGVGLDNTEEIRQIASADKFMYTVQDFTLLEDVENDIVGDTCLMQERTDTSRDDIEMEIETDSEDDFGDDIESETDNNYEIVTRPLSVA